MRRLNPLSVDPNNTSYFLPLNQIYLGIDVMNMSQKAEVAKNQVMVQDVLEHCRKFLIISVKEIRARFDFNDPVLMLLKNITHKKVLSENRPASLINFVNLFPRIKENNQNIDTSWKMFSVVEFDPELRTFLLNLNVEDFWIKLKAFEKEYPFKNVSKFLLTVLS